MKRTLAIILTIVCAIMTQAATISVSPGTKTLSAAVSSAADGDVLELSTGEYTETDYVKITKTLTIRAEEGAKPVIKMKSYFRIEASLTLQGVTVDGQNTAEQLVYLYGTSAKSLAIYNSELRNASTYGIYSSSSAHTDAVTIMNCLIHHTGVSAVYIPHGGSTEFVPCDHLTITNSTVYATAYSEDVAAIDIREGKTYSENKVKVEIDHITVYGFDNAPYGAIKSYKSADVSITNCVIANPDDAATIFPTYCYGGKVQNCLNYNTKTEQHNQTSLDCQNITYANPLFADPDNGDFNFDASSPIIGKASDGSNLGDPRWTVTVIPKKTATLQFTHNEMSLYLAQRYCQNELTTNSDQTVITLTSDNPDIAAIEDDQIVMKAVGTTVIRAHINETEKYLAADASFNLTVKDATTYDIYPTQNNILSSTIAQAAAGDVILLHAGDKPFEETNTFTIDKNLSIFAAPGEMPQVNLRANPSPCIDDPEHCDELYPCCYINADVTMEGIRFNGAEDNYYMFLSEDVGGLNIVFRHCFMTSLNHIFYVKSVISSMTLDDCVITTNECKKYAFYFTTGDADTRISVTNCSFINVGYYCIYVMDCAADITIDHCTFYNKSTSGDMASSDAVRLDQGYTGTATVTNCVFNNLRDCVDGNGNHAQVTVSNSLYNGITRHTTYHCTSEEKAQTLDPLLTCYVDRDWFFYDDNSVLATKNIGDPRWKNYIDVTENDTVLSLGDFVGKTVNINLHRSLRGGMYNAISFPFDIDESVLADSDLKEAVIGSFYDAQTLSGSSLTLTFMYTNQITAGTPYIINLPQDFDETMFYGLSLPQTDIEEQTVTHGDVSFQAALTPRFLQNEDKQGILYIGAGNTLYRPTETTTILRGLRAYFILNGPAKTCNRIAVRTIEAPQYPTAIQNIKPNTPAAKYLNNGHITIIKNNQTYNILGQNETIQ